jgi:Asp/Glu/hydantoin racemase
MHIRYVNPVGDGALDAYFVEQLAGCAGPDVEVTVSHLDLPDGSVTPFLPDKPFYQGVLFQTLKRAEEDGLDGVVIGCSGDPGLLEARRMMRIPVAAPLESALHLTALLHQRVAILVADGFEAHVLYRDLARYYGLDHLISEIITVPMSYPDPGRLERLMIEEPDEASRLVVERHGAVLQDEALELARGALGRGAGVIYPGCTFWTGTMLGAFRDQLDAPVLDPGASGVLMAVAAARARVGTRHLAGAGR